MIITVPQILFGLINKNPELDIVVNVEDQRIREASH